MIRPSAIITTREFFIGLPEAKILLLKYFEKTELEQQFDTVHLFTPHSYVESHILLLVTYF